MGTTPIIRTDTAYDAWKGINDYLLFRDPEPPTMENLEGSWLLQRDFGLSKFYMTLRFDRFWLPERDERPPFFEDSRLQVLKNRYIDQALWDEGVNRIRLKGGKTAAPMSYTVQFHRRDTKEMKTPTGGGCLVAMHVICFKKQYRLHFFMRASEVTCRLLSDLYFFRMMAREMAEEAKLKNFDVDNMPVDITILLASQVKHYIPVYLLYTQGPEATKNFFLEKPKTEWQLRIMHHFFEDFIWPENITWSQRKKWSEKFYDWWEEITGQSLDFRALINKRGDLGMLPPKQFRGKYITERAKKWVDKDEEDPEEYSEDEDFFEEPAEEPTSVIVKPKATDFAAPFRSFI